jgi:hypothetical protein
VRIAGRQSDWWRSHSAQAKDQPQHCGHKRDNSDENQDIGHDDKLCGTTGSSVVKRRDPTVKAR